MDLLNHLQRASFIRKLLIALVLLAGPLSTSHSGQLASGRTVAENLASYIVRQCGLSSYTSCDIFVNSVMPLQVNGIEKLPRTVRVHFSASGAWNISGGQIDFDGAEVDGKTDARIFLGSGSVLNLRSSRPEWFGQLLNDSYPSSAFKAAYKSTVPWGTIYLSDKVYLSPSIDEKTGACDKKGLLLDSPRTIVGMGRPTVDSVTAPHRLIHGSVIAGEVCGEGVIKLAHLGIDIGPYSASRWFAGNESFGVVVTSPGPSGRVSGSYLTDVSVLTTGLADQHSVLIENQRNVTIEHLWIWSLGGTHGLVLKSSDSKVLDFHCTGAFADCLIVKSDYDTDHDGEGSGNVIDQVDIHQLASVGDTGGVFVDARWDSLNSLSIERLDERGVRYGILAVDSLLHHLSGMRITDWHVETPGPCLGLGGTRAVNVTSFDCIRIGQSKGPAFLLTGGSVSLRDGNITCVVDAASACGLDVDGIASWGALLTLHRVTGNNLGGYLLRASKEGSQQNLSELEALNMSGRLVRQNSLPQPFADRRALKPYLRIAETKVFVTVRDVFLSRILTILVGVGSLVWLLHTILVSKRTFSKQ